MSNIHKTLNVDNSPKTAKEKTQKTLSIVPTPLEGECEIKNF